MISNLKSWLLGTHHGVSAEHLQVYLDEYVFRFNRRRVPMAAFQTLLGLGTNQPPPRPTTRSSRPDPEPGKPPSGAKRVSMFEVMNDATGDHDVGRVGVAFVAQMSGVIRPGGTAPVLF